jgi:hypothetical protein
MISSSTDIKEKGDKQKVFRQKVSPPFLDWI